MEMSVKGLKKLRKLYRRKRKDIESKLLFDELDRKIKQKQIQNYTKQQTDFMMRHIKAIGKI